MDTKPEPEHGTDRHGMHMVDEVAVQGCPQTDLERIEALEAEVAALKASNASLVQQVGWMTAALQEFFRMSCIYSEQLAKMAGRMAGSVTESEADESEGQEPG